MKNLLTFFLICICTTSVGQYSDSTDLVIMSKNNDGLYLTNPPFFAPSFSFGSDPINTKVITAYDTTVVKESVKHDCLHIWVQEKIKFSSVSCAVFHGAAGCPDNWLKAHSICRLCLKKILVRETRRTETVLDEYEELDKQLNEKK